MILDTVATVFIVSTPALFATLGETVGERAGIVNLGLEGQMLLGAVGSYYISFSTNSLWLGFFAGGFFGVAIATIFALMVVTAGRNQITSGLAIYLLGYGVSAFYGRTLVGQKAPTFSDFQPVGWGGLGIFLSHFNSAHVIALIVFAIVLYAFYRTRLGTLVKAVGASADSVFVAGYSVRAIRFGTVLFNGFLSGLGGAVLALAYSGSWSEGMTHGIGWISVALVVVATWEPLYVLPAVLLYGSAQVLAMTLQVSGVDVSPYLLDMIPYVVALAVMAFFANSKRDVMPRELKNVFSEVGF
ncbi:MAG: ABC transporter permease [Candidatus Binataceae bacterium]